MSGACESPPRLSAIRQLASVTTVFRDPRCDSGAMGMGAVLQAMTRFRLGHWLPVAIVAAAAVLAFLAALNFSLTLPVEVE